MIKEDPRYAKFSSICSDKVRYSCMKNIVVG
jgi:hypothetical protein